MLKTFDKENAGRGCKGTIFGTQFFTENMEGYLDELVWGYLKKGMKVYPHKHPQKEVYIFVRGKGTMQVNDEKMPVKERDVVFIPPNSVHTAWNDDEEDLEFILVRAKNIGAWTRRLVKVMRI
ncbi:MAG TPA: cupin domain-containing protein [Patescibacteria group bacterium]|nr:cupin domain-containing protein [Patescibacteria group bacterium]